MEVNESRVECDVGALPLLYLLVEWKAVLRDLMPAVNPAYLLPFAGSAVMNLRSQETRSEVVVCIQRSIRRKWAHSQVVEEFWSHLI